MRYPQSIKEIEAVNRFNDTIVQHLDEIDEGENIDWFDLAYGFFLAQDGLTIDIAWNLALYVHTLYQTPLAQVAESRSV